MFQGYQKNLSTNNSSAFRICAWDPMWGPNNQIWHLAAIPHSNIPFWHLDAALCVEYSNIYSCPKELIQCAGSFHEGEYIGSASIRSSPQEPEDQLLYTCKNNFKSKFIYFQQSKFINSPNNFFSNIQANGRMRIAFRDPHIMPNGRFAVVTGGIRWGCTFGNICEISINQDLVKITRETILGDSMMQFKEIERPTFIDNWMFFSPNLGKTSSIHIAKLNKAGVYDYHGELKNSQGCYGPAVSKDFKLLYWYKPAFTINNPKFRNLMYENGEWILIRESHRFQPSHKDCIELIESLIKPYWTQK